MKKHVLIFTTCFLALAISLTGCQGINGNATKELNASGIISATEINIASQIGGTVVSVNVNEGSQVKKGDVLFQLDDALLQAQRNQASAAVTVAEKAVNSARVQYDIAVNSARLQDQQNRVNSWKIPQPDEFDLPAWYFDKEEKINSAQSEVDASAADLEIEKANLEKVLADNTSQEFLSAEKRLADAQVAFLIADQVLTQANEAQDKEDISNYANDLYDTAKTELSSAQTDYKRLLTTQAATEVLEARARVRVAQERLDRAIDYLNSLESGDQSLMVQAADSGVQQAEAVLAQAQAALALIDIQLEKTTIKSPADGVVLTRNLEEGEMLVPGSVALIIGQLQEVSLTVYIPETEYGKIKLDDSVSIAVDSFPGKDFTGTVSYISDQAEFTPRNVQTVDGRKTTVYAVKITVPNTDLELKPGMPADVIFGQR
ncbi:MAG TPA: efflux RND transporter periplasmic adaptor subunit [Anaerolineaceae bacterium]|nr:efflux RND transporter periplasmic adaptor subunit [Anaerolineaceae bacterium]